MKKIMFLCHGAGNGGAERVITSLANEFAARGNIVVLVTTKEDNNDYVISDLVVRERVISRKSNIVFRTIDRIIKLRSCIKKHCPDYIVSFSSIPNMQVIAASIGLKTKIIISERTDPSRYPTGKAGRVLRRILYPFADKIVFQTKEAQDFFPDRIKSRSTIIANPISKDTPDRYLGKREKRIVGVGSLGSQKNWFVALEACKSFFLDHPDYYLEIYGEGPDKERLTREIENCAPLRERVRLMGFSEKVIDRVRTAAFYISSSDYEGISNAMLEALAVGTPVICTDCPVGGARMFIENGKNGFLYSVGDSSALYNKMCTLADNDELCKMFSENSVKIKDKLKLSTIVDLWEAEMDLLH